MRLIDADKVRVRKYKGAQYEKAIASELPDEPPFAFMCGWNDAIDSIAENAPTVDIDAITESHEKIGYDKGFRDGYAQATSEVRHGRWQVNEMSGYKDMTCLSCGWLFEYYNGLEEEWNYCPHCGAKMDGERKEDAKTN